MVDLVFRNESKDPTLLKEGSFVTIVQEVLDATKIKEDVEVSITLVEPEKIRELNRTHRGKDAVTDVLSFPLGESPVAEYTTRILGDIFICPSYAAERASHEDMSIQDMTSWLVVHGTLHLLGYDHETSVQDRDMMYNLERTILSKINAKLPLHLRN